MSFRMDIIQNKNRQGFTLAEVLITLVVIGIVSAMTIQIITANTFKQEILSKLKKTYSSLSQAVLLSKQNNGPVEEWYEESGKNAEVYYNTFLKPYLQESKICTGYKDCGYDKEQPWKTLNGKTVEYSIRNNPRDRLFIYLSDGIFVSFLTGNSTETFDIPRVYIDINGGKRPNVLGKDIYELQLDNTRGVVPMGMDVKVKDVNWNCSKKSSYGGGYCLKKIISDGWQFKKGYPI